MISLFSVLRTLPRFIPTNTKNGNILQLIKLQNRQFSNIIQPRLINAGTSTTNLLGNPKLQQIANDIPKRTLTKFSWRTGKRKTVKSVVRRFFRLHWGGWIRTKAGRHKKLWKKSPQRRRRLRQHVFCNAQQSSLLDKMVTRYWKKPKYYIDDPYAPYHTRDEFHYTYNKPRPYFPKEDS